MTDKMTATALILATLIWLVMLLLGGDAWAFDIGLLRALYAGDYPLVAGVATFLTHIGGWIVLTLATLAATVWLWDRREPRKALLLIAIVFGGRTLVALQKYLSDRARPGDLDHLVSVHSMSFPSGHAANATATFLAIALLLFGTRIAVAAAFLLAFGIGLSRILLGVHWPSDVIGGWAFGIAWTIALVRLAAPQGTGPDAPSLNR